MKKCIIKKVAKGRNKGQWRFNLVANNGQVVCTSGSETYHNLVDLKATIANNFADFAIIEEHKKKKEA